MPQKSWPDDSSDDQRPEPTHELDMFAEAVNTTDSDEFLSDTNLGLGNYSEREYWQQVESYRWFLYADGAFGQTIEDLAIYQTIYALGKEALREELGATGYDEFDPEALDVDAESRRAAIMELGNRRWEHLEQYKMTEAELQNTDRSDRRQWRAHFQLEAIREETGIDESWTSPHGRMIAVRHEASRGKNARLIDNLFGRVRELIDGGSNDVEVSEVGGEVRR